MAQFTWNNFTWGLSDFSYRGNEDQWTDGENVDIYTDPFRVSASRQEVFVWSHINLIGAKTISPAHWINYYILWSQVVPHNNLGSPLTNVVWATHHLFVYEDQTVESPTFVGKNYFFWWSYPWGWIKRTTDATPNTVDATITIPSLPITDIVQVYTSILFSQWSKVYSFDLITQTVSQKAVVDTIPFWENIVWMHFYMDTLYIITNIINLNRVKVYTLRYEWGMYDISNYHSINWVQAVSVHWDNGNIYWASEYTVYITNWYESQILKKIRSTTAITRIRWYKDGIIALTSHNNYTIKPVFPWSKKIALTKHDWWYVDYFGWLFLQNWSYYSASTGYCETSYNDSNTFELWDINRTKTLTGIAMHCNNKRWTYIDTNTPSKIEVYIKVNDSSYTLVWSYTENSLWILYISDSEIINALNTAWISPEFQTINIRIKMYAWDKFSWWFTPNVYRFSPSFSKVTLSYDITDDILPR